VGCMAACPGCLALARSTIPTNPSSPSTSTPRACILSSVVELENMTFHPGSHSAVCLHMQVPTLAQAVAVSSKPQAKGITKAPPSKGMPPPSPVAAAAAAASCALSVVRETAAGFNLYCPAGQYQLSLKHPASKHMFDQLLLLRTQQQQLLQQVKAQQQQQQQQTAAAASREPHQSGPSAAARVSVQSRRASRADIPVRADLKSIARASSSNEPGTYTATCCPLQSLDSSYLHGNASVEQWNW